ncbi:MAG: hypothetical protein ACTSVL_13255 [Promethearchaeota archaeon]
MDFSESPETMEISKIIPSQLYLNEEKLKSVQKKCLDSKGQIDFSRFGTVPIKKRNGKVFFTDGHHRAYLAFSSGCQKIPIEWDNEDLDWELYDICVKWCEDAKILTVGDLKQKIISNSDYQELWIGQCEKLHSELEQNRQKSSTI